MASVFFFFLASREQPVHVGVEPLGRESDPTKPGGSAVWFPEKTKPKKGTEPRKKTGQPCCLSALWCFREGPMID